MQTSSLKNIEQIEEDQSRDNQKFPKMLLMTSEWLIPYLMKMKGKGLVIKIDKSWKSDGKTVSSMQLCSE